jgi:hypothetical protein
MPFGNFTVTVLKSKHSVPIPGINNDIGQVIDHPLKQPSPYQDFKEGGTFDIFIKHGDRSMLIKPSDNWLEGALDNVRADVLFLGTATMGNQSPAFRDELYNQTVGKVHPHLLIPVHWNDFTVPLSNHLVAGSDANLTTSFDFLIKRLSADNIEFGIMQGYQSVMLFGNNDKLGMAARPNPSQPIS